MHTKEQLTALLKKLVSEEAGISVDQVDVHKDFSHYNLDSLHAVFIMNQLEDELEIELTPLYFWDHPTIDSFCEFLVNHLKQVKPS